MDEIQESPEIAGLLYKRRGGFGKIMPNAWQYRFFVITKDGVLLYFDTAEEGHSESKARGRVDLRAISYEMSMEPIEGAPTPYFIQIAIPNEEKWKLCAETKEDQGRWFSVLEKYAKLPKILPVAPVVTSDDEAATDKSRRQTAVVSAPTRTPTPPPGTAPTVPLSPSASPSTGKDEVKSPLVSAAAPAGAHHGGNHHHHSHAGSKTTVAAKKRFLKSNTKASAAETLQWYESVAVLVILNICFLGVYRAQSWLTIFIYCIAGNGVIWHTLRLREARISAAAAKVISVKAAVTEAVIATAGATVVEEVGAATVVTASSTLSSVAIESKDVGSLSAVVSNGKPIAGCTLREVDLKAHGKEPPSHTWAKTDSKLFHVRIGPDYNRFKKKAPSAPSLYEPVAFDIFCTKKRADHVAQRFQLPDVSGIDTHHPHVPPLLIIQVQIPSEPPPSIFSSLEDGPGWALVTYYRITEDTCNQLKDLATASPAVKLFAEWCEKAPTDAAWRGRFKVICLCTNFEELGFPSMITAYNGKPVLIRRTGSIFTGPGYLEMNIHVHKFANMAKQSIYMLTSRCNTMYMNIGFVIEGREDKELPETLFACVAVNRPQEDQAEFLFDED